MGRTRTEQLAARFASRIRDHLLPAGTRLPSVRQCAQQQGVSPSTVVSAYDQLQAQGLIEARPHRGFFVREVVARRLQGEAHPAPVPFRAAPADAAPGPAEGVRDERSAAAAAMRNAPSAASLMRGMFNPISDKPQPAMGMLPSAWLQTDFLAAAVRKAATQLHEVTAFYGDARGDAQLREVLAMRLQATQVPAQAHQVITTAGATQALDIIARTLLRPGDSVMVESPGWSVEFARLQALGLRMLPVPRGPEGPDLAVMARYCEAHAGTPQAPRLFISVSVLHNPTGYCLSPASAHRLLQLAHAHDFYIAEDDTYQHLAPEHMLRLSALDGLQRCIYVSGFSKILAPGWRIGYLAAPERWLEPLLDTKLLASLTAPALLERALAHCIEHGQLRRHALRVQAQLDAARSRSVRLARQAGARFVAEPAGLFGWVDTGVDTERLAQVLLDDGYLLAAGALFDPERAPSTCMRINFASTQTPEFWRAYERARERV
ncbi:GntR family transcriptional regulator [Comamonas serinivorans]|uniref:GntR family transcriptional regulator n=2 Tax=Comamonas serinivorans TaxID=1082851 RepID=A0A1Y0ESI4_9BURK|nr:GntR family transcriptional regulator [Comamonas serinivorans]